MAVQGAYLLLIPRYNVGGNPISYYPALQELCKDTLMLDIWQQVVLTHKIQVISFNFYKLSFYNNIFPEERVIYLSSSKPHISIGRASKNPSKALYSSTDNAWFDSPVMSRNHARLSLNLEYKTLSIQDIGSMHGTLVNDAPLASHIPIIIQDGDTIVFGAEVKRGSETFSACKFGFNYEISQCRSSNTFAFPESSDGDDEAKLDDHDLGQTETVLSFKQKQDSINSLPGAFSESEKDIDYSRDQSFSLFSGNKKHEETQKKTEHIFSTPSESTAQPTPCNDQANKSTLCEMSSDFIDYDDNDTSSLDSCSSESSGAVLFHREIAKIRTSNQDEWTEKNPLESWNHLLDSSSKSCYSIDNMSNNSPITKGDSMVDGSECNGSIRNAICDFGISNENSWKSDDSCVLEESSIYDDSKEISNKAIIDTIDESNSIEFDEMDANPSSADEAHHIVPTSVANNAVPYTFDNKYLGIYDMVSLKKPINFSGHGLRNELCVERGARLPWNHFIAHKAGKSAYFRAREFNKAKYNSMENASENKYTSYVFSGRDQRKRSSLTVKNLDVIEQKLETLPSSNQRTSEQKKTPTRRAPESSQNIFLTSQVEDIILENSAAIRNRIDEIVDTSISTPCYSESNKRKADSNLFEFLEESQNLTRKLSGITSGRVLASKMTKIKAHNQRKLAKLKNIHADSESRPTKRQKVIENFRYMAIGGITAAAGLFSVLVATAPEFE